LDLEPVSWRSDNTFPYYWAEYTFCLSEQTKIISVSLLLGLMFSKVYTNLLYCTVLSYTTELTVVTVKEKAEEEALIT
jgi:hypothetical protein